MKLNYIEGRGGIRAAVVAASVITKLNGELIPIYTLEVRLPKSFDAEFEKHRMLSSNSSSSRAIPVAKSREMVKNDPFIPISWRKEQKGMQGYEELADDDRQDAISAWLDAAQSAIEASEALSECAVHKQTANRVLEPFLFQKKVVTATEWSNFFRLRLAPDAQPEMQELAWCMRRAMELCVPVKRSHHLPYITDDELGLHSTESLLKWSSARCARVSYNNLDNSAPDPEKDEELYGRLLEEVHMTPMEHQAFEMNPENHDGWTHCDTRGNWWSGNFRGWTQHRQLISTWN